MRTGRPVKADAIYKMSIHVNGKHRYASTQPYTIGVGRQEALYPQALGHGR